MVGSWFGEDPLKLLNELEQMELRYPVAEPRLSDNMFYWFLPESVIGRVCVMLYPDGYPLYPPKLWVLARGVNKFDIDGFRETTHQNQDGSICLYTSYGDGESWSPLYTAADMVDKFKKFVTTKPVDEHWSIQHDLPGIPQQSTIFLPAATIHRIETERVAGRNSLQLNLYEFDDGRPSLLILLSLDDLPQGMDWRKRLKPAIPGDILAVQFPFKRDEFRSRITTIAALKGMLVSISGIPQNKIDDVRYILPIFQDSAIPDGSKPDFQTLFSYCYKMERTALTMERLLLLPVHSLSIPRDCFQRTRGVLQEASDKIKVKCVVLVGIGTLGSTVAIELAKSGVCNFVLYDTDIILPVNVCRHEAGLSDIGKLKVEAVKQLILDRNPEAIVISRPINPFGRGEAILQLDEEIKKSTLTIVTTGDHYSEMMANKMAVWNKTPLIVGSAGHNARQGEIIRILPGKPCLDCISRQRAQSPGRFPAIESPEKSAVGFEPRLDGYRQPGIPGISIDIGFIALFIARMALQTLLRDHGFPDATCDYYIWQNRSTGQSDLELVGLKSSEFQKLKYCATCSATASRGRLDPGQAKHFSEIVDRYERKFRSDLKNLRKT